MKTYILRLTEWQLLFLKWVADGCNDTVKDIILSTPRFIQLVRHLRNEGLIEWHTDGAGSKNPKDVFFITQKGMHAINLWGDE